MKPGSNHFVYHRNLSANYNPNSLIHQKKRWPEDDLPPPVISQNHYRHIHEQRDFTLENLSMGGDTEVLEFDDYKIIPEYEWRLDLEIQDLIIHERRRNNSHSATNESSIRMYTDCEDDSSQVTTTINKIAQKS
jgi:hypothetical protein